MNISDLKAEAALAAELGREVPTVYGFDVGEAESFSTAVYMECLDDGSIAVLDITQGTPEQLKVMRRGLVKGELGALDGITILRLPTVQQLRSNVLGKKGRW